MGRHSGVLAWNRFLTLAEGLVHVNHSGGGHALPLVGIRVVDLTSNIAGPYCGAILADFGADVIHVEGPHGDDARRMSPVRGDQSAYFAVVNRNKRTLRLDIGTDSDLERLLGLIGTADVFLTNLRPHKLSRRGLDAETLRTANHRLIHAGLSAYGADGREAERPGYDAVVQARTGLASVTGHPESPPARVGVSILDFGSGMWMAMAVIAAIRRRDVTGEGAEVTTSLFETGATWSSYHIAAHQVTGLPSTRHGSGHPAFAPYGIFSTADGELCIGIGGDGQFRVLCGALGVPELAEDERFTTNPQRVQRSAELRSLIEERLLTDTAAHWSAVLAGAGLPVDVVQLPEALLNDPQASDIGILDTTALDGEPLRIPGLPVRIDGVRPTVRRPATEVEADAHWLPT